MPKKYTREEIEEKIDKATADMATFYQQPFINYCGRTTDTGEYYTEIIAEWCCNNIQLLESIQTIPRERPYRVETHDGIPPTSDSPREEELIAMKMFRQRALPEIGGILDYQTPLKAKKDKDGAGKIDLLAYDGKTLRILELKKPTSEETMLRCVLEGYTYLKAVDTKKLLKDFNLPADTVVVACPFVFAYEKSNPYQEMQEDRPHLKKLMQILNSEPYYIREDEDRFDIVVGQVK